MGTILKIAAVIALTMILGISGPGQIREGAIPDESTDKNEAVILPGMPGKAQGNIRSGSSTSFPQYPS